LISFQKRIPGFYDSIKDKAAQAFLLFQKNVETGIQLSECVDQSFQVANTGLHVSLYFMLQTVIYEHTKKEPATKNLIVLSGYIRQYTGLFIEDGFPDTIFLRDLFVFAVKIALLPIALIEEKLCEWESAQDRSLKILSYTPNE
jgi:hypothetical protein